MQQHIIGQRHTGKSAFFAKLALQYAAAKIRFCVTDSYGDFADELPALLCRSAISVLDR
ncbi:hypothetical protein [Pseudoroseicyclus sp. CXY001]|uniref:hypothetical protein n=1 Tax=Pseudoroseicyclus sp. CXY001 TaxID=3242492 RepID=UPI003570D2AA